MRKCLSCGERTSFAPGEKLVPLRWACSQCGWAPDTRTALRSPPGTRRHYKRLRPRLVLEPRVDRKGRSPVRAAQSTDHVIGAAILPDAKSYLEIGCGTGFVLAAMAKRTTLTRIAGSELHPRGLEIARQRLPDDRAEWIQMDACAIPAFEEFDLIGAYDVIEHIEEDERYSNRLMRACVPAAGSS